MRESVEKGAKNAKRKKIHTRTNHHQITWSRSAGKPGDECRRSSSDNGSEFIAKKVRKFLSQLSVKPLFIEPGSPWENGYIESFTGKMRAELLAREIFYSLKEAQVLIEMWRKHYNTVRPHSSLGYKPPAPATIVVQPSQIMQISLTLWLVHIMGAGQNIYGTPLSIVKICFIYYLFPGSSYC